MPLQKGDIVCYLYDERNSENLIWATYDVIRGMQRATGRPEATVIHVGIVVDVEAEIPEKDQFGIEYTSNQVAHILHDKGSVITPLEKNHPLQVFRLSSQYAALATRISDIAQAWCEPRADKQPRFIYSYGLAFNSLLYRHRNLTHADHALLEDDVERSRVCALEKRPTWICTQFVNYILAKAIPDFHTFPWNAPEDVAKFLSTHDYFEEVAPETYLDVYDFKQTIPAQKKSYTPPCTIM